MSIENIPTYYQGGTFDPSNNFNIYESQQINNLNGPVDTQNYIVESTDSAIAPLPNGNTKMVIYKVQKTGVVLDLSTLSGTIDGQSITVFNDFSSNFP